MQDQGCRAGVLMQDQGRRVQEERWSQENPSTRSWLRVEPRSLALEARAVVRSRILVTR